MKKKNFIYLVIFTLALFVFGGLYYFSEGSKVNNNDLNKNNEKKEIAVSKNKVVNPLTEKNNIYGDGNYKFSLAFPENWKPVSEEIKEGMANTKIFKEIILKLENDNERYLLINIVKIEDKDDPSISDYPQMYVTENKDFAFYYSGSADNAGMPGMDNQKYFDIQKETIEIIKSFKTVE